MTTEVPPPSTPIDARTVCDLEALAALVVDDAAPAPREPAYNPPEPSPAVEALARQLAFAEQLAAEWKALAEERRIECGVLRDRVRGEGMPPLVEAWAEVLREARRLVEALLAPRVHLVGLAVSAPNIVLRFECGALACSYTVSRREFEAARTPEVWQHGLRCAVQRLVGEASR